MKESWKIEFHERGESEFFAHAQQFINPSVPESEINFEARTQGERVGLLFITLSCMRVSLKSFEQSCERAGF